jgi:2-isopropylmalate synthase
MSNDSNRLIIFDTTLRDGEQSPGASMTRDEKLRIAKQLERLRVDVIEAGFAAASQGDFESIRAIASAVRESTICSLSRANDRDIARAAEALAPAERKRIHTFIATSPLHMEMKLRMTPEQVLEQAKLAVRFARGRHHDQLPGHGGLCGARNFRRHHQAPARAHPQFGQGHLVGALPQRSRTGGGQLAGRRDDRWCAPD